MRPSRAVVLAALALGIACASAPEPPDWLGGSSPRYPTSRFTTGVGAAASPSQAAEEAAASVARQLDGESEGTRVAETWRDPSTQLHWALAVLDRPAAVERLASGLAEVQQGLRAALRNAETAPAAEALTPLARALDSLAERDGLRARIVLLGGTPAPDDATAAGEAARLRERLAELKSALRIEVDAFEIDPRSGEPGDRLDEARRALTKRVLDLGFAVETGEAAWGNQELWLRVEAKVSVDRLKLLPTDTLVAVRWTSALEIADLSGTGDVIALETDEGRATHLNETEARRLAESDARESAAAALEAWLRARITGAAPPG